MGKGGDAPPLRVKTKSPPLWQKNGYPYQKIHGLFYSIPPFLGLFYCTCFFFQSNWVVETVSKLLKKHFLFSDKQLFFCVKIFLPPPSPPLHPGYGSLKHHLPYSHFWPMYTWKKILHPLYEKSGAHVWYYGPTLRSLSPSALLALKAFCVPLGPFSLCLRMRKRKKNRRKRESRRNKTNGQKSRDGFKPTFFKLGSGRASLLSSSGRVGFWSSSRGSGRVGSGYVVMHTFLQKKISWG